MADDQFSIIFSILFFAMLKKSKDKKYKTKQKKYEKTVEKILPNSNWNSTDSREKKVFHARRFIGAHFEAHRM
jgi:hypothetical protein